MLKKPLAIGAVHGVFGRYDADTVLIFAPHASPSREGCVMSLDSLSLQDFIRSAPVCVGHESLGSIFDLFSRSRSDRLVLVDAHHQPLGVIRLSSVLPSLPQWIDPRAVTPPASVDLATLITPLIVVPQSWSVRQFLCHLPQAEQEYGVVNAEAQFVGMLDSDRLLASLIPASTHTFPTDSLTTTVTGQPVPPPPLPQDATILRSQQQQILSLTQQLLVQRADLEQRIKAQQEEIQQLKRQQGRVAHPERTSSSTPFPPEVPNHRTEHAGNPHPVPAPPLSHVLLELLERLPLPLMLQTDDGQIVAQNAWWRQQVEGVAMPIQVWQAAAACLATEPQPHSAAWQPQSEPGATPPLGDNLGTTDPWMALPEIAEGSRCQLGTQPNSCICVRPSPQGGEQVLQFVKVSLGTLLPDFELDWAIAPPTPAHPPLRRHQGPWLDPQAVEQWVQLATLTAPNPAAPLAVTANSPTALPSTHATPQAPSQPAPHSPNAMFTQETAVASPDAVRSLWLVIAQDVTQQQQLARELTAKNADLVQLNRLKDEFLACISHELKTPLTAVLGLSSLLKDQTLGELNPRQIHYAELIYQSSRHLMGVVNDILDLTRIETGQLELLYGAVDIPAICHRAFEQAKQLRLLDSKHAPQSEDTPVPDPTLVLEIDPSLGLLIADEMRLRQMLVHLLSNSLKFTESHKPVGLKVSRWGGWIAFTVWDAGIGIPPDKQHLIFQKFQQLENPLTRQFEGAGLGLVLTRQLARLHGGDVTFISKEGLGSQFTILLPPTPPDQGRGGRTDDPETSPSASPTLHYPGGRVPVYSYKATPTPEHPIFLSPHVRDRLILIVEAVPQFIEALTEQLTGLGYRVVVARSGTEALEKARRLQPSVIFLNPLLPLLSGWDVLTLLKSGTETKHIPVVVTATVMQEGRTRQQQANGFLTLPVQPQRLQLTLQQLSPDPQHSKPPTPTPNLTILRLFGENTEAHPPVSGLDLSELLRSHHYRILESDDLEQAELLASVWQPNVVILEGIPFTRTAPMGSDAMAPGRIQPQDYLKQLSRHPILAALPIITLDAAVAQAANQVSGLQVFPCLLESPTPGQPTAEPDLSTLLQVIQMAAGHRWRSTILAVDLAVLGSQSPLGSSVPNHAAGASHTSDRPRRQPSTQVAHFPQESEWLQALTQYLQTAGFEALLGQSWQEVIQQITSHSVDVLVLCWTDGDPQPAALSQLRQLREQHGDFPIIVLDHRDPELVETHQIPLPEPVRQIATAILSPPIAMAELLDTIQQTLR